MCSSLWMVPADVEPLWFHPDGHQPLAAAVSQTGGWRHMVKVLDSRLDQIFSYWSKELSGPKQKTRGSDCLFVQKWSMQGEDIFAEKDNLLLHKNKDSPSATAAQHPSPLQCMSRTCGKTCEWAGGSVKEKHETLSFFWYRNLSPDVIMGKYQRALT